MLCDAKSANCCDTAVYFQQEALWATLIRAGTIDTFHHVKSIEFLTMGSFSERLYTSVCKVKKQKEN